MRPELFNIPFGWLVAGTVVFLCVLGYLNRRKPFAEHIPLLVTGVIMLAIEFWSVDRKAGLAVPAYGFMIMVAFVTGTYLAAWRAKRWGIDPNLVIDAGLYGMIFSILGARMLFVIQFYDVYYSTGNRFWDMFKVWQGGLVFYGGFIAALAADIILLKRRKANIALFADLCLPSVILGEAITRIGCFLNGCCFGKVCHLPWAVSFPAGSHVATRHTEQVRDFITGHSSLIDPALYTEKMEQLNQLTADLTLAQAKNTWAAVQEAERITYDIHKCLDSLRGALADKGAITQDLGDHMHSILTAPLDSFPLPVHPSQLYATLAGLAMFGILLWLTRKRRFDGQIGVLAAIFYAVCRFGLEMTRSDNNQNLGLTISQWISVGVFAGGLAFYFMLRHRGRLTSLPVPVPTAGATLPR
ncbi:MAG: prolipoprotein diacylglyceryl transferase [Planctomycetota bacterium]